MRAESLLHSEAKRKKCENEFEYDGNHLDTQTVPPSKEDLRDWASTGSTVLKGVTCPKCGEFRVVKSCYSGIDGNDFGPAFGA